MANAHAHSMASFGSPVGASGLAHNFAALFGSRFSARRSQMIERARIRRELDSYSDRELRDLGISRSDIEAVANGRFAR